MSIRPLLHPLTLAFSDSETENRFQDHFLASTLKNLRISILLLGFAYSAFGILDHWIVPEVKMTVWTVRYLFVCPMMLLFYALSYTKSFRRYWQFALSLIILASGFSFVFIVAIANAPGSYLYYAGIIMVLFSTFLFLRFTLASAAGWIVVFGYNIVAAFFTNTPIEILVNNNFFLVAACVSIMFTSYTMELSVRRTYFTEKSLQNAKQKAERLAMHLKRLSALDGLTGVANRRAFDEFLEKEWRRSMRTRDPLSLIMFDIDFFKLYNDSYGHQAGDDCLKKVASRLKTFTKRPGDLVARYGGEEFAIVLSGAGKANAVKLAQGFRQAIEDLRIVHRESKVSDFVTVSIGVATIKPERNSSPSILIKNADKALYSAKETGRNRVAQHMSV